MADLTITRPMQQPLCPRVVALWLTKRNRGSVRPWFAVGLGIPGKFGPDTQAPTGRIDPRTAELAVTRPTTTV